MNKSILKGLVAVGVLTAVGAANAATGDIDISTVTTAIAAALVAVGTIGAAVLGLHVAVKAYHWVRAAMS